MVKKIEGSPKCPQRALRLPNVVFLSIELQGVFPPTVLSKEENFSFSFLASFESSFLMASSSFASKSGSLTNFSYFFRASVFFLKKAQVSRTDLCLVKMTKTRK